jgi:hypothetical protein
MKEESTTTDMVGKTTGYQISSTKHIPTNQQKK